MRSGLKTGTDATPTSVGDGSIEGVTLDPQALGWGGTAAITTVGSYL